LKNWQSLLQPFYQIQLLREPFLWTLASGGQWISLSEAFFLSEDFGTDSEVLESVRTFLVDINIKVVDIPKPLLKTIKKHLGDHIRSLSPKDLRNFCRQNNQSLNEQPFETKLNLLEYILSDRSYGDLTGIQLLPLDDGNFEVFNRQRKHIFIESENHPKSLLMPGFSGRFLNPNISRFIKEHFVAATGRISKLFL
jgi:sacsin